MHDIGITARKRNNELRDLYCAWKGEVKRTILHQTDMRSRVKKTSGNSDPFYVHEIETLRGKSGSVYNGSNQGALGTPHNRLFLDFGSLSRALVA